MPTYRRNSVPLPRLGSARRSPSGAMRSPRATQPLSDAIVAWGWYVDGVRQECTDLAFATARAKDGQGFVWLGLKDPNDQDMAEMARSFNLHPLAIEDAVEGHSRSKVEQFDDTTFAVVSTITYVDHPVLNEAAEVVETGQIMIFVGPGFVLTVRRGNHASLSGLRRRLELDNDHVMRFGPSAVLYGVMDQITDDYNQVAADFEADIDEVEELTFAKTRTHQVDTVYGLKRELIEFKRAVIPLGTPLMQMATRPFAQVPEDMRPYFRELSDHHLEVRESIASFDEILNTLLQAALARASVEDNQDTRKISAAVGILAIPTTIFGWYGMNFEHMPELSHSWGYPVVLSVTAVLMFVTYLWLRKHRWL